ncbi:ribonuclease P protein subunit p30 isoform X2 [Kryptolebias marmoratus]|uniref:ribonuclease P protein subunit p30 isoform X2 n=1 Tax=Kryptolebias marmoratus TaxID=37003 RepID=UPI000D530F9E|nr:ribonuclease P protein subunit p30 isoform X2 [Kryptolebias marmoratus]
MSVFMDLNLLFSEDRTRLQNLVETAAHLGFSTVAVNYVFEPSAKKKQEVPAPRPINELIGQLPVVQGRSRPIRVLNRLTVVMSDASHFRPNAPEYRRFDLLAVQPTTEKLFHAIDRGVVFEISYAAAIRDATMRRYTIANAVCLMESCKGKNVILASAAEKALELRGPYDIINLGQLFGLSDSDSKESVSSTCRGVLLHAETRKTASGVVFTMKIQQEALQDSADSEAPAAKRAKAT